MADGKLKEITSIQDISPGCIVREKGDNIAPFSDCVIMKIENALNVTHHIKLSRPYAFVSGEFSTSPSILLGQETVQVDFETLQKCYVQVVTNSEQRHNFKT